MAFYRGREVQVIRDARQGDPGWGSNDGEQVVVLYRQNGEQETVKKGEVTSSATDSGVLADLRTDPQPAEKRPETLASLQKREDLSLEDATKKLNDKAEASKKKAEAAPAKTTQVAPNARR